MCARHLFTGAVALALMLGLAAPAMADPKTDCEKNLELIEQWSGGDEQKLRRQAERAFQLYTHATGEKEAHNFGNCVAASAHAMSLIGIKAK